MGGYSNQLIEDHIKCRRVDKVVYGFSRSNSWDEDGFLTVDKFALIRINNRFVEMVSSPVQEDVYTCIIRLLYIYYILILIISMNYTRIT